VQERRDLFEKDTKRIRHIDNSYFSLKIFEVQYVLVHHTQFDNADRRMSRGIL
jgi:hypothetical protein